MYNNLKRILSLALTLALVLGMMTFVTISAAEENRGKTFTAGKDTYFYLDQPGEWKYISFEYKTEGAGELAVILRGSQWTKYHGDFRLTQDGEKVDYDGVTTEKLEDGYIRATFETDLLQRSGCVNNRDLAPTDIALIDIFQWTTVGGYIDNIQVYNNPAELVVRGQEFAAGGNNFYYLAQSGAWNYVSFDYKLKGAGELAAILRGSSWTKYYGDFRLTKEGEKIDYAGITTEKLEDGYIHVIFDIAQLTRTACLDNRNDAPEDIALIDIFGTWTTVNGYIDNIQAYNNPAELIVRGEAFSAGVDNYFALETGAWDTVSFEYKTQGAGEVAVIFRGSSWTKFYGDFRLTQDGEKVDYDGITTEKLEDGYIRATFDIAALQRTGCVDNRDSAPEDLAWIDIYNWTTVNGYIDNIQCAANVHTHAFENGICSGCGALESYDWVLSADAEVNLSLTEDLYVDLNGHTLTGTIQTNSFKVYGIDSATSAYTCDNMGIFSCVDAEGNAIVPEKFCNTDDAKYMTLAGEGGYSFHRYYVGITTVSLAPSVTGLGYAAEFYGDAMVQAQVTSVGYDLWLEGGKTVSRTADFQNVLTLRVKNIDAVNYGATSVNARATMTLADGTVLQGTDHSWSLQQMVEAVNTAYANFSAEKLAAVKAMIEANPVMLDWQVENLMKEEDAPRGQEFSAGKDNYFTFEAGTWDVLSFDYKPNGEGNVYVIVRGSAWTKFYGDFALNANGETVDYDGITTELLDDGYIRVTMDIALLGRTNCVNDRANAPEDIALIDIYNWTTVGGYIDNIQVSEKPAEEVIRGESFAAGVGKILSVTNAAYETVSFEYKLISEGDMTLILRDSANWVSKTYGDYRFTSTGLRHDYPAYTSGITCEVLADGYIRVTMDLSELGRSGLADNRDAAPINVGVFDIYSGFTTADGYIDNIQFQ